MNPDAYMPYYGNDFEAATKGHRPETKWAYLCALWHYWHHTHCEGLPNNQDCLRLICEVPETSWARVGGVIFGEFFKLENGVWHQKRSREMYAEVRESYDRKYEALAKARQAKADKASDTSSDTSSDTEAKIGATTGCNQNQNQNHGILPIAGEDRATEPPKGFPASKQEAEIHAEFINCPPEFASTLWELAAYRGWKDAKGQPIQDFRRYLSWSWSMAKHRVEEKKHAQNNSGNCKQVKPSRNEGTHNAGPSERASMVQRA